MEDVYLEILQLHKIPRGYIDNEDYVLILFLVYAHKEGLLDELKYTNTTKKKIDFINIINQHKDFDFINELIETIVHKISEDNFDTLLFNLFDINKKKLGANFKIIYEKLLFTYFQNISKNSRDYLQPDEITRLTLELLNLPANASIYNPFSGLASFAIYLKNEQSYYGQEINQKTWMIGKLRLLAHDIKNNIKYKNEDSIWYWPQNIKFDAIIANPPINQKIDKELSEFKYNDTQITVDEVLLLEGINILKDNGKLIAIVPNSFLSSNRHHKIRRKLVDEELIESVISLPSGLLFNTGISISIIILRKIDVKRKGIYFFDGLSYIKRIEGSGQNILDFKKLLYDYQSHESKSKNILKSEVLENNYLLNVNRYVYEKPDFPYDLNKFLLLKEILKLMPKKKENNPNGKIISIRDINEQFLNHKILINDLKKVSNKKNVYYIEKNALILNKISGNFYFNYIEIRDQRLYVSSMLDAFEVNEELVLPEYLILEFEKDYIKKQLYRYRTTASFNHISTNDLLNIKIGVPPISQQRLKVNELYVKIKNDKQLEINEISNKHKIEVEDENSFLRHQIATPLKNLRLNYKYILHIIENNVEPEFNNLYKLKYNDGVSANFKDYLDRIKRDLDSIKRAVDNSSSDIEVSDIKFKKINLIEFLKDYIDELKSNNGNRFDVLLNIDQIKLKEEKQESIFINGDKDYLRKMLDNIIDNADKHGFNRKINPSNKILFDLIFDFEDNEVQVDVSNTGNTFPEEYSHAAFTRKGDSSGEFAGDGTGGWFINKIINLHGGKFNFTDKTGPEGIEGEYMTTIELTFPIIINK